MTDGGFISHTLGATQQLSTEEPGPLITKEHRLQLHRLLAALGGRETMSQE